MKNTYFKSVKYLNFCYQKTERLLLKTVNNSEQ